MTSFIDSDLKKLFNNIKLQFVNFKLLRRKVNKENKLHNIYIQFHIIK